MKRAFIRLFGCILSAIGLSMSYDATFTMLLDDDSAPGVAYGSTGTGSGSGGGTSSGDLVYADFGCEDGFETGRCVISALGDGWVQTGYCNPAGQMVDYYVTLNRGWYVAWFNNPSVYSWGADLFDGGHSISMDYEGPIFSMGTGSGAAETAEAVTMNGLFYEVSGGVLCTGVEQGYGSCAFAMKTGCIGANGETVGFGTRCAKRDGYSDYLYMNGFQDFVNYGCKIFSSCKSTDKCCYAPATVGTANGKTIPRFAEILVFYEFQNCDDGYYQIENMKVGQKIYGKSSFQVGGPYTAGQDVANPCDIVGGNNTNPNTDTYGDTYRWTFDNCRSCPVMTSISNDYDFSPTITSFSVAQRLNAGDGVGVESCRYQVLNAKDSIGTFNIVDDCVYDY